MTSSSVMIRYTEEADGAVWRVYSVEGDDPVRGSTYTCVSFDDAWGALRMAADDVFPPSVRLRKTHYYQRGA